MRQLYLDLPMGAAGDMLMAALYELCTNDQKTAFLEKINALGLHGISVTPEKNVKCGITGTHMNVLIHGHDESEIHDHNHNHAHHHYDQEHTHGNEHNHTHEHHHHHEHHSMADIRGIINALDIPEKVKSDALAVYAAIAAAESEVHGTTVEEIHFHEVGAMDAVADVVGVCLLMYMLNADTITASPVHVGSGTVHCAHGIMPVPAPATARILLGIPTYGGTVRGELCTPTGAALIAHFVNHFGPQPPMTVSAVGYGMGTKNFEEMPNCVRVFLGKTADKPETITVIECNLDDMTGEDIGFAMETLFENGALDVFTTPIGMKKSRPGIKLTCLCKTAERDRFIDLMLAHTTTIGVRYYEVQRKTLPRTEKTVETPCGKVRLKVSTHNGVEHVKPEYDDVSCIARKKGLSLKQVRNMIE